MKTITTAIALSLLAATGAATALATTSSGPEDVVACTKYFVGQLVSGRPIEPCAVGLAAAASPDPKQVVACTGDFVRSTIEGRPYEPCAVGETTDANVDPKKVVACTKAYVAATLQGRPFLPCDVSESAVAANQGGIVEDAIACAKSQVKNFLQGTVWMCEISPEANAGPMDKVVWTVKCVGDALGGQSCHAEVASVESDPVQWALDCAKGGAKAAVGALAGRPQPYYCGSP